MSLEGTYPILIDGALAGSLTVTAAGGRTAFSAVCRQLDGVVRISVYGGGREGYLGVLAPEGGGLALRRTLSRAALRDFPAEIAAVGTPSVLVPSPYVPNNHQYYNGKALVDKDAAIMIEEKDLSGKKLKELIDSIIDDDERLKTLSKNAAALGNPNVLDDIVKAIEQL